MPYRMSKRQSTYDEVRTCRKTVSIHIFSHKKNREKLTSSSRPGNELRQALDDVCPERPQGRRKENKNKGRKSTGCQRRTSLSMRMTTTYGVLICRVCALTPTAARMATKEARWNCIVVTEGGRDKQQRAGGGRVVLERSLGRETNGEREGAF